MSDPMPNLGALNARLKEIGKDLTPTMVSRVQRKIVLDVLGGVIKRTPVDTGRARGGWQVSVGTPSSSPTQPEQGAVGDPAGKAFSQGAAKASTIPPFSIAYINNNVAYVGVLDQGGFVPKDPADDSDARAKRAKRRDEKQRKRAQAARGDEGATLVVGGYSFQAPNGMIALTLGDVLKEFQP